MVAGKNGISLHDLIMVTKRLEKAEEKRATSEDIRKMAEHAREIAEEARRIAERAREVAEDTRRRMYSNEKKVRSLKR